MSLMKFSLFRFHIVLCLLLIDSSAGLSNAQDVIIEKELIHIRNVGMREWSRFPETPQASEYRGHFQLKKTLPGPGVLCFEHQDVKQRWRVAVNGEFLGELARNENAMRVCFEVTPDQLTRGLNELRIWTDSEQPDDVRIGRAELVMQSRSGYLQQRRLKIRVRESNSLIPCRVTIINEQGALQTTGLHSTEDWAVRAGVIYTRTGEAEIGLPAGRYTVIASRGPEYGISRREVDLRKSMSSDLDLTLERVVETEGWIACDTHVHTLTHSGHGDSTVDERIITLAGEAVDLPVVTEHNKQVNYSARQSELGLGAAYTLVTGNEVTTQWGHFNIWPVQEGAPVPGHRGKDWKTIFKDISVADPEVIILNHAEDVHSGYRPFGRENRHRLTGRHLEGWKLQANAIEVINSGAQQSDIMQLPRDWMVCLNRGQFLTPVGCSDSHDVARHFVGQGRTYIRSDHSEPGKIDVTEAVKSFREGRVIVSCGLIPFLTVADRYGPGDLVPRQKNGELELTLQINTPEWIECDRYVVYFNGEAVFDNSSRPFKSSRSVTQLVSLPVPEHDVHIEVAAFGQGVRSLHWPIAKPYQPDSPDWNPLNFGLTGAVWYDGNGDGNRNCARELAETIWKASNRQVEPALDQLSEYDRAVALQLAELIHLSGHDLRDDAFQSLLKQQPRFLQSAFVDYWVEWRRSEIARAGGRR